MGIRVKSQKTKWSDQSNSLRKPLQVSEIRTSPMKLRRVEIKDRVPIIRLIKTL